MDNLDKIASITQKFAYYLSMEREIASYGITKKILVTELKTSSGMLHRAYDDMKQEGFEKNVVDYICFVGLRYLMFLMLVSSEKKFKPSHKIFDQHSEIVINSLRLLLKKGDGNFLKIAFKELSFLYKDDQKAIIYITILNNFRYQASKHITDSI